MKYLAKKKKTKCFLISLHGTYITNKLFKKLKNEISFVKHFFLIYIIEYEHYMTFTLLAAKIAINPNGQQQKKKESKAGTIQFLVTGVRL